MAKRHKPGWSPESVQFRIAYELGRLLGEKMETQREFAPDCNRGYSAYHNTNTKCPESRFGICNCLGMQAEMLPFVIIVSRNLGIWHCRVGYEHPEEHESDWSETYTANGPMRLIHQVYAGVAMRMMTNIGKTG